jgi:hypothetical protein
VSRPKCSRDVIVAKLMRLGACPESIAWVREQSADVTIARLWVACPSGEWLWWISFSVRCQSEIRPAALWATEDRAWLWSNDGPAAVRRAVGWTGFYDIANAWEALP